MYKGTRGWHTCDAITKRRLGVAGPSGHGTTDGAPYVVAVKLRTHGHHKMHRSFWEWEDESESWMLLVLDAHRNIIGQAIGKTQQACQRKMNAIYEAKGFGPYNSQYAD